MNKAAELISDSILENSFITVMIGKQVYTVYPPTIKVICRAISSFSKIGIDGEYTRLSVIGEIPGNASHIIKGLAALIVGDVRFWRWKASKIEKVLESATLQELKMATDNIIPLIGGDDFFECAACLKNVTGMAAKAK
ncbi:MAG: hypothetical protein RSO15_16460 [Bacteroides sp.]|uniref:hypothetical protein n=1 Tax=Bacteroides sp. TaxID=29523 RepID=UPI002FCB67D0